MITSTNKSLNPNFLLPQKIGLVQCYAVYNLLKFSAMKPYEQGALDTLCGVYSIVNAICKVTNNDNSDLVFKKIITYLDNSGKLSTAITRGMNKTTIKGILNNIVNNEIKFELPFSKNKNINLSDFWKQLISFIDSGEDRTILICLGGHVWSHWTIVDSISQKQIKLYDSFILKHLNRNRCTTQKASTARPHVIIPTHTFFISNIYT